MKRLIRVGDAGFLIGQSWSAVEIGMAMRRRAELGAQGLEV